MRHAVVAALVVAFAAGCGGHRPAGTIVFQSVNSGREAVYAVGPNGGEVTRLPVDLPIYGGVVDWTRDGTKALVMYDKGNGSIAYVFEAATGVKRAIRLPGLQTGSSVLGEDLTVAPWSPDGKRLLLATAFGNVALDVKTGEPWYLRDEQATDLLSWSADGTSVLFSAGDSVYAAPADGGLPKRLMRLPGFDPGELRQSSDGKWISFQRYGGALDELYVVRMNGTGLRLVARDADAPAWSPSGERLAFAGSGGVGVVDLATGKRRHLTSDRLGDPMDEGPSWSPDGRRILYQRNDLGLGAWPGDHMQIWTMKADGTDRQPVTHAFPVDRGAGVAVWVTAAVHGAAPPPLPLSSLAAVATTTTALPIVGLAAEGDRAAAAQGFGTRAEPHSPLGPIVVWNRVRATRAPVAVRGCGSVYDVLLAAGRVGYRCDNSSEGYNIEDSLKLGSTELVHTQGGEFTGSFLGGLAADGGTVAFDVASAGNRVSGEFRIRRTRIWKATGARKTLVQTFGGSATVASLDAGRIAVLRSTRAVDVLSPAGGSSTFTFRGVVLGAALAGPRLVVLEGRRLIVVDLPSGTRTSWPVRRGYGPAPELEDVQGNVAAYAVGATVHVLRLSDGHEIVIDTPNATGPVFARFVPAGLFYSYNESYSARPGRLAFATKRQLERALA
jgi:hypothetical protein